MPIPKPRKDETKDAFHSRCMSNSVMKKEFPEIDKRNAVCYDAWRKAKNMKMSKRKVLFHLSTNLSKMRLSLKTDTDKDAYDTVMIVGDGTYNGVYFPHEELNKAASSFEGKPININHNDDTIEDIVGYIKDVAYEDGKLRATAYFDTDTVKYDAVSGYINSRKNAGDTPNVSIGVWLELEEEKLSENETRTTARNLEGDHLAIVVHGACNPDDGCGIGMSTFETDNDITFTTRGYDLTTILNGGRELKIQIEAEDELKKNIYKELIKKERLKHE